MSCALVGVLVAISERPGLRLAGEPLLLLPVLDFPVGAAGVARHAAELGRGLQYPGGALRGEVDELYDGAAVLLRVGPQLARRLQQDGGADVVVVGVVVVVRVVVLHFLAPKLAQNALALSLDSFTARWVRSTASSYARQPGSHLLPQNFPLSSRPCSISMLKRD